MTDMHILFMNGLEMAAKLQQMKTDKQLKIVLMTADEVSDNMLENIDPIIEKPAAPRNK